MLQLSKKVNIIIPSITFSKELEYCLNKLNKQNENILNLKNKHNIKILLNELINDFKTSSNTNEENILKNIFFKCNITLFLIINKEKYVDNELKLNDLCLIKHYIDSKITYSLIKNK